MIRVLAYFRLFFCVHDTKVQEPSFTNTSMTQEVATISHQRGHEHFTLLLSLINSSSRVNFICPRLRGKKKKKNAFI